MAHGDKPLGECKACKATVVWLKNTKTRRTAPIDALPDTKGNCLIDMEAQTYVVIGTDLERLLLYEQGVELRTNHFQTCPKASTFRKSPPSTNPKGGEAPRSSQPSHTSVALTAPVNLRAVTGAADSARKE